MDVFVFLARYTTWYTLAHWWWSRIKEMCLNLPIMWNSSLICRDCGSYEVISGFLCDFAFIPYPVISFFSLSLLLIVTWRSCVGNVGLIFPCFPLLGFIVYDLRAWFHSSLGEGILSCLVGCWFIYAMHVSICISMFFMLLENPKRFLFTSMQV